MKQERYTLESKLNEVIKEIKHNKDLVEEIKDHMKEMKYLKGSTQKIINDPSLLNEIDNAVLFNLTKIFEKLTNKINVDDYYTDNEINKLELVEDLGGLNTDSIQFPLVLENVLKLDDENYITNLDIKTLKSWYDSSLIHYNFEAQRSPKYKVDKKTGSIIETPDINIRSVKEITNKMINYEYYPDTITLNALAGSSEEDELQYNEGTKELTINKCEIDILDGFHRLNALASALESNQDLELKLQVAIKNYDLETARKYFGQINTINKIDPVRLQSLKSERYSDHIVKQIMRKSDLKGKISESSRPRKMANQVVSFGVLSDEIDRQFDINTKMEANELSDFLIDFFDYIVGTHEEAFVTNIDKVKKESLINHNNMFIGYVVLARKFRENDIPLKRLKDVLNNIDFSRNNKQWVELNILENNSKQGQNIRNTVRKYFEKLDIK